MRNKAVSPVSRRIPTITNRPIYARCISVTEQSDSTATSELVETSVAHSLAPVRPLAFVPLAGSFGSVAGLVAHPVGAAGSAVAGSAVPAIVAA